MSHLRVVSSLLLIASIVGCGSPAPAPTDGGGGDASGDGGGGRDASGDSGSQRDGGALEGVCAVTSAVVTSDGESVLRCDELFAERPYVRVPAERVEGGRHTIYAAFVPEYGAVLATGEALALVDAAGRELRFTEAASWPARLHWPSARVLVYVYELIGERVTFVDAGGAERPALALEDARPAILLPADVIDGFALGAWEGTFAGRRETPDGIFVYDLEHGARFRAEYTSLTASPMGLIEWDEISTSFPEGARSSIVGAIVNLTASVASSDGTCLPALSASPTIPLEDATDGRLDLLRVAAMHAPGDMVLSHDYPRGSHWAGGGGMSAVGVLHPAAFIQDAPREMWTEYSPFPHGTPDGMQLTMHRVSGGGGSCD